MEDSKTAGLHTSPFICKPTNPESAPTTSSFRSSYRLSPALITQDLITAVVPDTWGSLTPWSPSFKLVSAPHPCLPAKITIKACTPTFPLLSCFLPPEPPCCFPMRPRAVWCASRLQGLCVYAFITTVIAVSASLIRHH